MASSGRKINYSLRPAKNVERKIMCEFFRTAKKEYNISDYRYIGFGSFYFEDFILMHKEFGIDKMISIEKDIVNNERFEFNKPFSCIDIKPGESSNVLNTKIDWDSLTKDIIWLDYDSALTESKLLDFETCIKKSVSGSFIIISFNSSLDDEAENGKLGDLINNCTKERVPSNISGKNLDDFESHKVFKKIIDNALEKSLFDKNANYIEECDKYTAKQIMYFKYKDAAPMLTIGYILIKNSQMLKYKNCKFDNIEFYSGNDDPCKIDVPNFTYKELQKINSFLPNCSIDEIFTEMPFIAKRDIEKYKKIYRYFPKYREIN